MKKTLSRISALTLIVVLSWGLSACSPAGGGSSSSPANNKPSEKVYPAYEVSGPSGEKIQVPAGSPVAATEIQISKILDKEILEKGETPVAKSFEIKLNNNAEVSANKSITVNIPITSLKGSPENIYAKVRLSTGQLVPAWGELSDDLTSYSLTLPKVIAGWKVGLVTHPGVRHFISTQKISPLGWLTEMEWQTCEWQAIVHNSTSAADVEDRILPSAKDACEKLQSLGLRSPRLWVANANESPRRVLHVIDGGSFYSANPVDNQNAYVQNATEHEMLALGQMYISYDQYLDLNQKYSISLENIISHELFHAVQYGYDIRMKLENNIHTLKAYFEGTATTIGQTVQDMASLTSNMISVRDLRDGEHMYLDSSVDEPKADIYRKQSFFAFVAKKYGGGSFAYTHQLFEQLAMSARGLNKNNTQDDFLSAYRSGMNTAFQNVFNKRLSEIYYDFAEERAFKQTRELQFHKIDLQLKTNTLAEDLFKEAIPHLDTVTEGNSLLELEALAPLTTKAVRIIVPLALCNPNCPKEDSLEIKFRASGDRYKVVFYAATPEGKMIEKSRKEYSQIPEKINFTSPRGKNWHYVMLVMNGSQELPLKFVASTGAFIDYILPTDAKTGDTITIHGVGFGAQQKSSYVLWSEQKLKIKSWSDTRIEVLATPELESKKAPMNVIVDGKKTNGIDVEIRNTTKEVYTLRMVYFSRAIARSGFDFPIYVKNGIVEFDYSEQGVDNGDQYWLRFKGKGTYDGKNIQFSGTLDIETYYEFQQPDGLAIRREWDQMVFTNAKGRWTMNIFFPGETDSSYGHYKLEQRYPRTEPQIFEQDHDPDISLWEWIK
ncbi:MAG: IPT/TIG domain-containing protein [Bdellovibrionia bacterium]